MNMSAVPAVPDYKGVLRSFMVPVPDCIHECPGIRLFGRRIRSLLFSTDAALIANCDADAVIAVYPFTPHPAILRAVMAAAVMPVLAGVGGGLTQGPRVADLAFDAESQGAIGVVVNAPTGNDTVRQIRSRVDLPVIVTVLSEAEDLAARVEAGVKFVNVSAAARTPAVVRAIRRDYPGLGIIATGGPTEDSIRETIAAGAHAITWTPPTSAQIFKTVMDAYRSGKPHP